MTELKRTRLPQRRPCMRTFEATIANKTRVFMTTGENPDGTLGEIFVNMDKEGSPFRVMFECFSILVSLCLQSCVPLSLLVKRFEGREFQPNGFVNGPLGIVETKSVIDYVFTVLAREYPEQAGVNHTERQAAE